MVSIDSASIGSAAPGRPDRTHSLLERPRLGYGSARPPAFYTVRCASPLAARPLVTSASAADDDEVQSD